jgi:hypothetical protein
MNTSITSNVVTEGQRRQVIRFTEDAVNRAISEGAIKNKNGAQKLIESGDDLQLRIIEILREISSDQFAKEEVESNFKYPSNYKVKSILEQIKIISDFFPEVKTADYKFAENILPPSSEGWFAIPKWQKVATNYQGAVERVISLIKKTRRGRTHHCWELIEDVDSFSRSKRSDKAFSVLGQEQKNCDILIVPCQFGLKHRGRSIRRALEAMPSYEFGLGAFDVGIMLLTHPERLSHCKDLWIDCPGDKLESEDLNCAPSFFGFDGTELVFGMSYKDHPHDSSGSASGMLLSKKI